MVKLLLSESTLFYRILLSSIIAPEKGTEGHLSELQGVHLSKGELCAYPASRLVVRIKVTP